MNNKRRLLFILQRFFDYIKNNDELIDKLTITLKQLSDEIYNLVSNVKSSNVYHAIVIVNAYQKNEYDITKHILNQIDILIIALTLKQLRIIK